MKSISRGVKPTTTNYVSRVSKPANSPRVTVKLICVEARKKVPYFQADVLARAYQPATDAHLADPLWGTTVPADTLVFRLAEVKAEFLRLFENGKAVRNILSVCSSAF